MRAPIATIIAALAIFSITTTRASDREEQFRAALRAWQPGFFRGDIVVRGPLSVAAIEREGLQEVRNCHHCPQVPFGYANRYWNHFKRELRAGDALIFFHSERKGEFGLLEGYAIIRNGKVWKSMAGKIS